MAKGKFTIELFDSICDEISQSSRGLVSICKDKGLNANSFYEWISKDKELGDKYAHARQLQAEYLADEIIEIADTPKTGFKVTQKASGTEVTEGDMIEHRRLQVDARKWKASKLYPKKYGDRVDVTSGGEKVGIVDVTTLVSNFLNAGNEKTD